MMSRQALTMDESRWAVVRGWEFLDLLGRAIVSLRNADLRSQISDFKENADFRCQIATFENIAIG